MKIHNPTGKKWLCWRDFFSLGDAWRQLALWNNETWTYLPHLVDGQHRVLDPDNTPKEQKCTGK